MSSAALLGGERGQEGLERLLSGLLGGPLRRVSVAIQPDAHRHLSTSDLPSPCRAAIVAHRHDMIISPEQDHERRPPMALASAPLKNGFGDVADRLDIFVHAVEADDAAGTGFEALVAPWKRADDRPLVQHLLDIASD